MKSEPILKARVIRPTTYKKKKISCEECGIDYSKRDYCTLFKAKKIVYFKFLDFCFCHDCFHDSCKEIIDREKIELLKIKLQDGRKIVYLEIQKD